MFGIKTKILNWILKDQPLVNELKVNYLMNFFRVDEYGHDANIETKDLGLGWIHYGLIRQQKPKNILCIGSRYGYIPAILAQACKDNHFGYVDFVDPGYDANEGELDHWTGEGYWKTQAGKNCFRKFGLDSHIKLYRMTDQDFALKNPENNYDYIYIDGNHSYEGALLDFKLFFPRLKMTGYMVFHDICPQDEKTEGVYGVWRLWSELVKTHQTLSINYLPSGLGILQKMKVENSSK